MQISLNQPGPDVDKPWSYRKAAIVANNFIQFCEMAKTWGDAMAAELLAQAIDGPPVDLSRFKPDANGVLASGEWGTIRLRSIPLRAPS